MEPVLGRRGPGFRHQDFVYREDVSRREFGSAEKNFHSSVRATTNRSVQQCTRAIRCRGNRIKGDARVDSASLDGSDGLCRTEWHDWTDRSRIPFAQGGHADGQPKRGRRVADTETQATPTIHPNCSSVGLQARHLGQDGAGFGEEGGASRGQLTAPRAALQESGPELRFKVPNGS